MQGVFLDTDGTLLNSETVPQDLSDQATFNIGVPGTTWQSAIDNDLFKNKPEVCVIRATLGQRKSATKCGVLEGRVKRSEGSSSCSQHPTTAPSLVNNSLEC